MGLGLSRAVRGYYARYERRILLLGLDRAGKSTILFRLSTGGVVATAPTQLANVEDVRLGDLRLSIWDVGGQDSLRPYWRHHFAGTQGLVFVVDASDKVRLELAASELAGVADDEQLAGVPIAVLVNKTDVEGSMSAEEVSEAMKLDAILGPHEGPGNRRWTVVSGCAIKGEGVRDAFQFVADHSAPL